MKKFNPGKTIYDEGRIEDRIKKEKGNKIKGIIEGFIAIVISFYILSLSVNLLPHNKDIPEPLLAFFGIFILIMGILFFLSSRIIWYFKIYEKGISLPPYKSSQQIRNEEWIVPFSSILKIDWRNANNPGVIYFWVKIPISTKNKNAEYKIKKIYVLRSDIHDFNKFRELCNDIIPTIQIT